MTYFHIKKLEILRILIPHPSYLLCALRRADLMRMPKIWGTEKRETNLQLYHYRTIFHMKPEAATQKYSMESGALKISWWMCLWWRSLRFSDKNFIIGGLYIVFLEYNSSLESFRLVLFLNFSLLGFRIINKSLFICCESFVLFFLYRIENQRSSYTIL